MSAHATLLKASALEWLRYKRQCMVVSLERPPAIGWFGVPDCIGVNLKREITEVEVKLTMADFRANKTKRCMLLRDRGHARQPHLFYFLVPHTISAKAQAELPEGAGLLVTLPHALDGKATRKGVLGIPAIESIIRPKRNKEARTMTVRELANMVRDQSGTLVSAMAKLALARLASRIE